MRIKIYFDMNDVNQMHAMGQFIAELVREGIVFTVEKDEHRGFEVVLTGGC